MRLTALAFPSWVRERVRLGAHEAVVLEVPAHTAGHIAYHFADEGVIFVGETMFAMGCSRLFEGTACLSDVVLRKQKRRRAAGPKSPALAGTRAEPSAQL